jgi:hypothetical protein
MWEMEMESRVELVRRAVIKLVAKLRIEERHQEKKEMK